MTAQQDTPGARAVRKIRLRAALFLGAAIVAGIAAVFLVKLYLDQARRRSTSASVQTTEVVVAARDIPSGMALEASQLDVIRWPAGHAPAGSFSKVGDVVGQTSRDTLVAGEAVLMNRLATKDHGRGLAALLDPGTRAMTVKVDQVIGIAGFVQTDDRVDVLTTIATDEETQRTLGNKAEKMSKIILQDIRVLAVGEHLATDGREPVKVQAVTLAVKPDESERLALASQYGTIQLTMRSRVDRENVATEGVTPLALLSPDDGVMPATAAVAAAAAVAVPAAVATKEDKRPPRRAVRRPTPPAPVVEEPAPRPPAPAVIEILRGTTKVEERKIKPQAGGAQ